MCSVMFLFVTVTPLEEMDVLLRMLLERYLEILHFNGRSCPLFSTFHFTSKKKKSQLSKEERDDYSVQVLNYH